MCRQIKDEVRCRGCGEERQEGREVKEKRSRQRRACSAVREGTMKEMREDMCVVCKEAAAAVVQVCSSLPFPHAVCALFSCPPSCPPAPPRGKSAKEVCA